MRSGVPGYPDAILLEDDGHVVLDTIDACIFVVRRMLITLACCCTTVADLTWHPRWPLREFV